MDEAAFQAAVAHAVKLYERASRHGASRTRTMIETYGEVEALSRLMVSPDLQQGFKVLRDSGQLDQTFEAVVVRFRQLFRDEVVQAAQWRLDNPDSLMTAGR
jgi:hypothetical protein